MLNAADAVATVPALVDYEDPQVAHEMANGAMNTGEDQILANIAYAIRQGHPQMRTEPPKNEMVCLVGSGPSLDQTWPELRRLVWEGATLVTLNGAYHYCMERNLRPQTQIVMDARPTNARFVQPYVPKCNYVLASQCAPAVWDAVKSYQHVRIWHPVVKTAEEGAVKVLNRYYGGAWIAVGGGTTVATRALMLLRIAGYLRFHLFGIDCCWSGNKHHALPQPENDGDIRTKRTMTVGLKSSDRRATFEASGWHAKQLEDFLSVIHVNSRMFQVEVHGDGMLAYVLREFGTTDINELSLREE